MAGWSSWQGLVVGTIKEEEGKSKGGVSGEAQVGRGRWLSPVTEGS